MRLIIPIGRSGWAIAAGYLGLLSFAVIPGPFAVLCGALALKDIQRSEGSEKRKYGKGRAWFGIIAGLAGTVFGIVWVVQEGGLG